MSKQSKWAAWQQLFSPVEPVAVPRHAPKVSEKKEELVTEVSSTDEIFDQPPTDPKPELKKIVKPSKK